VNAPPDYNSDYLFKSNLTFCVVCVFNLQVEKLVFLRRVVHSQSTRQRQLRRQILKMSLLSTVRSKIKKIEMAMINTLQLAARKNLIQMSLQW
jgi:hypothetical protein